MTDNYEVRDVIDKETLSTVKSVGDTYKYGFSTDIETEYAPLGLNEDIVQLIEDKKQKEKDKVIHDFKEEGIRVEKARWGRSNIIKGKVKIELPKTVDAQKLTLEEVKDILEKQGPKPKKKATKKKTTRKKSTAKKK